MINLRRDVSFKASLIRNWLIQVFWWIIFFPGFFSADSFAAVDMARTGNLTNAFTASWALYVRTFSFHGNFIGLLTLLDGLILVYAVTRFAYSIFENQIAALSSLILTLTPLVWGMGITLWHDIPMTSGLLLVVVFFTKFNELGNKPTRMQVFDLCLGSILISFRPNGLPTLLLFLLILVIFKKIKINDRFIAISSLLGIAFTLLPSYFFLNQSPINSYYAQEWMRNDISCYASTAQGNGFVEEYIPGIGSTSEWRSSDACGFLNTYSLNQENRTMSLNVIPRAWLQLFLKEPIFISKIHLKRNAYLIPIPINGFPNVPFIHSNIEFNDKNISPLMPEVVYKARFFLRAWNALRVFLAWAGLWFLITLVISRTIKGLNLMTTLLGILSLFLVLFIFSPIPDSRYALIATISGQLVLTGWLVSRIPVHK